ncbi:2,4-dienoyl-CoA reductase-like NADH-dependent reductase (Old Yellow Enzyme family) [Pedobacter sp. CG_S7]|uniref:NADH:flavin oxidoreductase n=1 Tax=Pedobacter sp. CG_S7 TaxID=3143930 RepID=UPI003390E3C4
MNIENHPIFQPTELWNQKLINRTVVAPMTRVSATVEGLATDEMAHYYSAFAEGGFGIIITEGIYTDNFSSQGYPNQPGLVTPNQVNAWRKVTQSIKRYQTLIFAQLMHSGALSQYIPKTFAPSAVQPIGVQASAYGGEGNFLLPAALSMDEISRLQKEFILSAVNAYQAVFDGVEIHGANGYLLDQFLTPELNKRTDRYGGNMQNRFRIIAELIAGIRKEVPTHFIIGLRISEGKVNDMTYRWKDGAVTAKELLAEVKTASPDFVHVAVQTGEWERDSFYPNESSLASIAREVTGLPVIANGGLHQLDKAAIALDEQHADLIAIGKAALVDPHWPIKTLKEIPTVAFHRDMLWPEATISHSQKIIKQLAEV